MALGAQGQRGAQSYLRAAIGERPMQRLPGPGVVGVPLAQGPQARQASARRRIAEGVLGQPRADVGRADEPLRGRDELGQDEPLVVRKIGAQDAVRQGHRGRRAQAAQKPGHEPAALRVEDGARQLGRPRQVDHLVEAAIAQHDLRAAARVGRRGVAHPPKRQLAQAMSQAADGDARARFSGAGARVASKAHHQAARPPCDLPAEAEQRLYLDPGQTRRGRRRLLGPETRLGVHRDLY
jgi:hypothetical protein